MSKENFSLSILELHARYRDGTLSPQTLCDMIREKIETFKDYNIWIHSLNDNELKPYLSFLEGKSVDELPLFGIPFAIKDNIDLGNIPTTAACKDFTYIPEESAFVIRLLIDAGAIPIGKTNLDQFATGLVGTRSPYGAVKNAFDPDYISGGSSSGSAVAVALGLVSFSLGTDTAGSGRIPAAFNNLIGLKPSKGRLSTSGVVPACRSLDCVSIFALNPDDTQSVFNVLDRYDPSDDYAIRVPDKAIINPKLRIGIPHISVLEFFNNNEYAVLFDDFIKHLTQLGHDVIEIDFTPFCEAAKLLYEGPWVAERYAAIEGFIQKNPNSLYPVTKDIISPARSIDSVETYKSFYRLQAIKNQTDLILNDVDFILTPTSGTQYRIDEIEAEPILANSNLGYYTNFMNLLDYTAIAIPAGFTGQGLPFGVTLFGKSFTDHSLLSHAKIILKGRLNEMGATMFNWNTEAKSNEQTELDYIDIAVCGAHLLNMPLNHQLTDKNAVLIKTTRTAKCYRFYALAGGPPYRPGLMKVDENGAAIEVEVWRMPLNHFGSFMLGIPAPLGIGKALLEDGEEVNSFICEAYAIEGAEDITHFGGWRSYIGSKAKL